VDDYGTQDRIVRRVTLKGEVPVGVNGQVSQTVKGPDIDGV
jgi:taurine dioxygenase